MSVVLIPFLKKIAIIFDAVLVVIIIIGLLTLKIVSFKKITIYFFKINCRIKSKNQKIFVLQKLTFKFEQFIGTIKIT